MIIFDQNTVKCPMIKLINCPGGQIISYGYRIVQNVDGVNFNVFDGFQLDHQNFHLLKVLQCMVKDTDHPSNFSVKYLKI